MFVRRKNLKFIVATQMQPMNVDHPIWMFYIGSRTRLNSFIDKARKYDKHSHAVARAAALKKDVGGTWIILETI